MCESIMKKSFLMCRYLNNIKTEISENVYFAIIYLFPPHNPFSGPHSSASIHKFYNTIRTAQVISRITVSSDFPWDHVNQYFFIGKGVPAFFSLLILLIQKNVYV